MINISELTQTAQWKKFMAKLYGWGAALVILGALFKLMHWPMASTMLIIGMSTETIIFFFSAFEPIHEDVDWTLVYPELAGISEEEEFKPSPGRSRDTGGTGAGFGKLDEMLANAEITPELFEKLGKGLKNLNQTTQNLMNVADAAKATNQFVDNLQSASESVSSMTESYSNASQKLNTSLNALISSYDSSTERVASTNQDFIENYKAIEEKIQSNISAVASGNQSYNEKLELINKNLSALNSVYELQLKNTNEQVKNSQLLTGDMEQIINNLKSSAEETAVYKTEMAKLNKNLSALNSVYGNMLSAMNIS